ncbi:putative bifunctional diguanylate cyclase/phosphodiesterase [Pararhizobium arenae]|uniref:putative bifunctional diguanylate cyclase/phosphodiesterase n=1 Tax=Pararhizobium arenae TaxID=1856850 RepID=UPI00094AE254|nr:EAL domain-containing protein [Pararhizobium arenae]
MTTRRNVAATVAKFAEATNYALISIDSEGKIEFVNPSGCALFGYERDEMMGHPITIIIPERMRGSHMMGFARAAAGAAPNLGGKTVEVFALRKDGSEFPIEITLSVWRDRKGFSAGAIIKDISERRDRESRLLRLASQDDLTGLHNRHQFMQILDDSLQNGEGAAVILIDLDGFKDVNDSHGHAVGDALLQAVGVRLPYLLEPTAAIARLGGDEFAVFLPGMADPLALQKEAAKILDAFRRPFNLGGLVLDLASSIGIAISPHHGRDSSELVASADFALYRAKNAGGRCSRLFDHTMRGEANAHRTTRDELRTALREGQLAMYYQPQINLPTKEVIGFEALIRWHHPVKGLLTPGAFLPSLEQSALALEIGWWTLDQACAQISRLNRSGSTFRIGVNLFPSQFRALNLRDKVEAAISKHAIRACDLELEITEEVALSSDDRSLQTLCEIREMGVGIAFDDFGTGFASLSSLQRYPITKLKIDRSFVCNIQSSKSDAAIARALISLSRDLGVETIAEGVETDEQEEMLQSLSCPLAQGFRYGRPMAENELRSYLESRAIEPLKRNFL